MKWHVVIVMAALLSIAPGFASAQQQTGEDKFPKGTTEGKFPEGQPAPEGKFPTGTPAPEGKMPAPPPAEKGKVQATPQAKAAQAEPARNLSPKEEEYLEKTAVDLAAMQKKIDALKVKKQFKTPQRARANRMVIVDLQKRALNARKQFAIIEKAPDMAYSGLKTEMDKTMLDLKKTYSDALQFFE
jgi:hypothetical protein